MTTPLQIKMPIFGFFISRSYEREIQQRKVFKMKNFKLFGIIVMVAVIGFSLASCGEKPTWTLKVVNESTSTISVGMYIDGDAAKWSGTVEAGQSKSISYTAEQSTTWQNIGYSVSYIKESLVGDTPHRKEGRIDNDATVTVTIKENGNGDLYAE
jgi:hypothetical protein